MNDSISSPIFWMYFSYVLSFIIPLFCGLTLLTVKGAVPSEQAGMHPRRLLGIIFTFSGLIFIPNMIQDIHKYITGELGLPIFDIAINLFLVPLYFFYFRKLTKPEKLTSRRIWPHLMPGISVLITSFFSHLVFKPSGAIIYSTSVPYYSLFTCLSTLSTNLISVTRSNTRRFMKRKSFPLIPARNHPLPLPQAKRNYPLFFPPYPRSI